MAIPALSRQRTLPAGRTGVNLAGEIERVVAGEHPDPHSVLGAHAGERGRDRAGVPARRVVGARAASARDQAGRARARPRGGRLRGARCPAGARCPDTGSRSATRTVTRSSCADPYGFLPTLGELDLHLITEGRHEQLWNALGAHPKTIDGTPGTAFSVWAPGARAVSVAGDFNSWNGRRTRCARSARPASGSCSCPRPPPGRPTSSRSAAPTASCASRPTRWRCAPSCRRRPARSSTSRATTGATTRGRSCAGRASRTPARCRSTRCTSARGGSTRSRATAR